MSGTDLTFLTDPFSVTDLERQIDDIYTSNGWGSNYSSDAIRNMFREAKSLFALHDNQLVGFIRGYGDDFSITHMTDVIVHKQWQRHGVGRALVQAYSQRYAHTTIYLNALAEAVPFFEKMGFPARSAFTVHARKPVAPSAL